MDLFTLFTKGKALVEAVKVNDWKTAADLAGDLLKLAAQFLPSKPALASPNGDLMPLTLPGGFDLDKLVTLIQLLKSIFGK